MKNILLICAVFIICSCSNNKVTKTLYGAWEPILESADTSTTWGAASLNFILSVEGSCEDITVTKTAKGDIANDDIAMADAKCSGNRDQLNFVDADNNGTVYSLKLDDSRDTLIGTFTRKWDNAPDEKLKVKFLRISGGE